MGIQDETARYVPLDAYAQRKLLVKSKTWYAYQNRCVTNENDENEEVLAACSERNKT